MTDPAGYDYIIVGAGSAGCVLANRLTEDPDATVLLLEAGGSDRHPAIQIPLGLGRLWQRRMFDWGYDTEPEPCLDDRRVPVRLPRRGSEFVRLGHTMRRTRIHATGCAA